MLPTVLLAFAALSPAHALDCASVSVGGMLPADGSTDVALNSLPMVEVYGHDERLVFELLADGEPVVDASWERIAEGDPEVWQLTAPTELAPDTAYTVLSAVDEGEVEPYMVAELAFVTGTDRDTAPPADITEATTDADHTLDEWGDLHELTIDLVGGADDQGTAWMLEFWEDGTLAEVETRIRLSNPATVQHGWCTFDPVAERDPSTLQVRIWPIDAAGNVGDPVDRHFDTSKDGEESRCSFVPGSTFSLASALLGLVGLARRRRQG